LRIPAHDDYNTNEEYVTLRRFVRYQKRQWAQWTACYYSYWYNPLVRDETSNMSLPLVQRLVRVGLGTMEHGPYKDDDDDDDKYNNDDMKKHGNDNVDADGAFEEFSTNE
jgi:hypothetical protein